MHGLYKSFQRCKGQDACLVKHMVKLCVLNALWSMITLCSSNKHHNRLQSNVFVMGTA